MAIRLILIIAILLLLIWFLSSRTTMRVKAIKKLGLLGLSLIAVISVLYPDLTNQAAHRVGVGRGADLLLYLLAVAFIASMLNQYMKSKEDEAQITKLARKIALIEAKQKEQK